MSRLHRLTGTLFVAGNAESGVPLASTSRLEASGVAMRCNPSIPCRDGNKSDWSTLGAGGGTKENCGVSFRARLNRAECASRGSAPIHVLRVADLSRSQDATVTGSGRLQAIASAGQTTLVAAVSGVSSQPLLVELATLQPGVVVVRTDQIVGSEEKVEDLGAGLGRWAVTAVTHADPAAAAIQTASDPEATHSSPSVTAPSEPTQFNLGRFECEADYNSGVTQNLGYGVERTLALCRHEVFTGGAAGTGGGNGSRELQ